MADILDRLCENLTGFAPYTPVTVSSHTFPYQAPDQDVGAAGNRIDGSILEMQEAASFFGHLPFNHGSPEDDGFNPYGSGPEPIGRREG